MIKDKFKKILEIETRTKYFTHFLLCLLVTSIISFSLLVVLETTPKVKKEKQTKKVDAFETVKLEAKSAIVWDVVNGKTIFSKNCDEPLPLASLTKIMTAVTVAKEIDDNQKIKITPEDLSPEGDSNLIVGDIWRARELRDFTLLTSSNDGAYALASVIKAYPNNQLTDTDNNFVKNMNDNALDIGLLSSKFFNEHGLDRDENRGGAYGSARDMAMLFEYALKNYPEVLEATRYKNLHFASTEKIYSVENTNVIVDQIPNLIASKTGYTDLAGGNLIIAFDAGLGRPIIITVLGSTEEGRFADVLKLVEATKQQLPNL
jgi:D-alanyl-D-alanine carboxypeptidase (penicillin-binding protein 5/6)